MFWAGFSAVSAVYLGVGVCVRSVGGGAVFGAVGGVAVVAVVVVVDDDDDDADDDADDDDDIAATENICLPVGYPSTIYISRIVFLSTLSVYGLFFVWLLISMDYFYYFYFLHKKQLPDLGLATYTRYAVKNHARGNCGPLSLLNKRLSMAVHRMLCT